jgi:hypothetical protein
MVTYIVITNNKQNGDLSTSKPFFSHEEAEKEMWKQFANVAKMSIEEAKNYVNPDAYGDYYISTILCDCEIHSIIFSDEDMLTMQILEAFYKLYPVFNDYKYEWRAKFQDMLVNIIKPTLPRLKDWETIEDFINECLIGEEMYEVAVANLGGDVNRTEDILSFIDENTKFAQIFENAYGIEEPYQTICGLLVLAYGDENAVKEVRGAINEWCKETKTTPIFTEPQYVYRVSAYYDMNLMIDEEIIQELYATEELAQKRVRYLIDTYKNECHTIEDCEPYGGEWDEDEYKLYAYMDSEWNVDISYVKEEVKTKI